MAESFEAFEIPETILRALKQAQLCKPSKIQQKAIPPGLRGENVIAQSGSGSGKTVAFAITCLARIDAEFHHSSDWDLEPIKLVPEVQSSVVQRLQCLVLCPTREIAVQCADEISRIGWHRIQEEDVTIVCATGGVPINADLLALRIRQPQILVATTGRLLSLLQDESAQSQTKLQKHKVSRTQLERFRYRVPPLKQVIFEEADRLLTENFRDQTLKLVKLLSQVHSTEPLQCLFFSATYPVQLLSITQKIVYSLMEARRKKSKKPRLQKSDEHQETSSEPLKPDHTETEPETAVTFPVLEPVESIDRESDIVIGSTLETDAQELTSGPPYGTAPEVIKSVHEPSLISVEETPQIHMDIAVEVNPNASLAVEKTSQTELVISGQKKRTREVDELHVVVDGVSPEEEGIAPWNILRKCFIVSSYIEHAREEFREGAVIPRARLPRMTAEEDLPNIELDTPVLERVLCSYISVPGNIEMETWCKKLEDSFRLLNHRECLTSQPPETQGSIESKETALAGLDMDDSSIVHENQESPVNLPVFEISSPLVAMGQYLSSDSDWKYWDDLLPKFLAIISIIWKLKNAFQACCLFCNDAFSGQKIATTLCDLNLPAAFLSSRMNQSVRLRHLQALKNSKLKVLVCSDVLARGIDVPEIDLVLSVDLPHDKETVQHRIGRAGRFGRSGKCIFVMREDDEMFTLKLFAMQTGFPLSPMT
eukprot:Gregarina_sp_Poly_1__7507@NODE_418_length_8694_cov_183_956300_g340_i0_p1_GENE_NODE_418_length_8694_cov_183_956300_g340_i0NODE_418_length_8694_cov_183_956300_g340_i0_p1_ORF_typecomplete_len710_score113_54DEAD/PF00270_29/2_5e32Helicase_C/PF00271_31/1_6e03Helicase_C/PF00271_31/5_1e21Helicase_C/PF00271_31/3e03ERCC3_RAD25_C/PF16203_5/3_1e07ResIII/PF04851_15/3_8e07AAA_19/PF13245_6/0_0058AAA_11/PF13086_6/0_07AAA_11/PF13086_6/6_6e03_NODE_418_length_8694_cov_183_956300_g340_i042546383